jgi:hypothetical protein
MQASYNGLPMDGGRVTSTTLPTTRVRVSYRIRRHRARRAERLVAASASTDDLVFRSRSTSTA